VVPALLDLGCGRGQLAIALLLAGVAQRVTGLDIDSAKIALARRLYGRAHLRLLPRASP